MSLSASFETNQKYLFSILQHQVVMNTMILANNSVSIQPNDFAIAANTDNLPRLAELMNNVCTADAQPNQKAVIDSINHLIRAIIALRMQESCEIIMNLLLHKDIPDDIKMLLSATEYEMTREWSLRPLHRFECNFAIQAAPYREYLYDKNNPYQSEFKRLYENLRENAAMPINYFN